MRRHRLGIPALLLAAGYMVTVVVAAVSALVSDDIGLLVRLTLFYELETDPEPTLQQLLSSAASATVTWPKVIVLLAVGGMWAWALWQGLRGPVTGARPAADRNVRLLRVALYASVAVWLVYISVPEWPWWAAALEYLVMLGVAVAFCPLMRPIAGVAGLALFAGVTGNVLLITGEVLYALGWRAAERMLDSTALAAVTYTLWTILVLVVQWRDGRWRPATVRYGVAALLAPLALILPLALLGIRGMSGDAVDSVAGALTMIWLARSAHDLADPDSRPAPPRPPLPLPARPYTHALTARLVVAAKVAACAVPLIPVLVNLSNGYVLWITAYLPLRLVERLAGGVPAVIWWIVEAAVGAGGLAVLVLVAACRGTRRAFRVAMTALLLTAAAGFAAAVGVIVLPLLRIDPFVVLRGGDVYSVIRLFSRGWDMVPAASPLWFTLACLASAALLSWAHTMRGLYPRLPVAA
ncbi:hypothetical protein [Nonomuraea typhae]|uniref:DUF2029 domain-containing protein n=1 Tax=Nonomuraea typhae TaxID=2603600 RepID=A0ABW7YU70_9ACTN